MKSGFKFKTPIKFAVSAVCSIPLLAVFGLLTFSASTHAGPVATEYEYEVFDAPVLPPHPALYPTPWTQFTDINDHGIVVWISQSFDPVDDHFIEASGLYDVENDEYVTTGVIDYDDPSESGIHVYGVNNRGELVTGENCQFVTRRGELVQLAIPGYDYCTTRGISNKGVITGFARTVSQFSGDWISFIYYPKTETIETFLSDTDRSISQGINSKGQVAGSHGASADRDGFVYNSKDGTHRFFKVRIGEDSYPTQARGIADDGTIVGAFTMDSGVVNGFVGRLSDDPADTDMIPDAVFGSHNVTECEEVFLTRINSSGIVAGFCWADDRFVERGLLLTPIIED